MTTVVILLLGLAEVLMLSAIESNPDGSDVSVIQTVKDIWNDDLNFQQGNTPASSQGKGSGPLPQSSNAGPTSQIQSSTL